MADPTVEDYVLSYQDFRREDKTEPEPPFVCKILGDKIRTWYVEYIKIDGTTTKRRILKGACSSKSLDPRTVDPRYKELYKRKRIRL